MPTKINRPGEVISAKQGTSQLKAYNKLLQDPKERERLAKTLAKHNAFLFHKDHITRFFNGDEGNNATHFMVVIGIKNPEAPSQEWLPTVMVFGCREAIDTGIPVNGKLYSTLPQFKNSGENGKGEELSEHPDGDDIDVIEPDGMVKQTFFVLKSNM